MSTSSPIFGFTLPEFDVDQVDVGVIQDNFVLLSRLIKRLRDGNLDRQNDKSTVYQRKVSTGGAGTASSDVSQQLLTRVGGSGTYTTEWDFNTNFVGGTQAAVGDTGVIFQDTFGYTDFGYPGYYRYTWNVRAVHSTTAHISAALRTGLFNYAWIITDPLNYNFNLIERSVTLSAGDTHTGITDIGNSIIIKVGMQGDTDCDLVVSGTPPYPFSGDPQYGIYPFISHGANTGTITIAADHTWIHTEYLGAL